MLTIWRSPTHRNKVCALLSTLNMYQLPSSLCDEDEYEFELPNFIRAITTVREKDGFPVVTLLYPKLFECIGVGIP